MGVAGLEGNPAYPEIKNLPPVPLEKAGEKIANAFNKLKWHWWPSYSGIATKKFKNRKIFQIRSKSHIFTKSTC